MINMRLLNPSLAATNSRRKKISENSRRQSSQWLANKKAQNDSWADEFLTTKRKSGENITKAESSKFQCQVFPHYRGLDMTPATDSAGESDSRAPDFPPGPGYQRLNADSSPNKPEPRVRQFRTTGSSVPSINVHTWDLRPGRKSAKSVAVSARSKDLQRGRVDPSATFHGINHEVETVIDSHKSRPQRKNQESPELKSLLDSWERKTGKTAPSRR